jgi:nucleoside-diphosphate-sugar epimerase
MKILLAGATGVLGRAFLPHVKGHEILGLTRVASKLPLLKELGADGAVCDVYQPGALLALARHFRPDMVINFLTDLAGGPGPANSRIRQEGAPIVVAAAQASGARRLVVESISFPVAGPSQEAVAALESGALQSGLDTWVLRFGRFWGPGTWEPSAAPPPPAIHVDEAGRRAAALVFDGAPGTYVVEG